MNYDVVLCVKHLLSLSVLSIMQKHVRSRLHTIHDEHRRIIYFLEFGKFAKGKALQSLLVHRSWLVILEPSFDKV